MTFKLGITFADESQKISTWKNLAARVAAEEQNRPGLWKFAGDSGSDSKEIANWGLRYISIKTLYKNDNCLFRRHPRTPASCDTVVWIQPWTRNEKIGSKWVQTWMFGRQTFEIWETNVGTQLTIKELTETGNRASKLSGIQVSDCLTAWSIWPDLRSHSEIFIASIRRKEEVIQFETLKNSS